MVYGCGMTNTPHAVHLRVHHEGGRVTYHTVTHGPAFDALKDAPLFTQWHGWAHTYERVP
jgi:hypothetical protein